VPNYWLLSGKTFSQYALYSLIFSPLLGSVIKGEQHEKYLYDLSSHYRKYRMLDPWGTRPSLLILKLGVPLDRGVPLRF